MSDSEKTPQGKCVSSVLSEFEDDADERIQAKLKMATGLDVVDQIESLDLQIFPNDTILSRGCKWLTNLSFLCLSHSNIESLRDLGTLPALKVLWISECSLNSLDGVSNLPCVQQLYASYNNISDLYPCIFLEELSYLDVEENQVSDFTSVESLVLCPSLASLALKGNPICCSNKQQEIDFDYCEAVRKAIPQLEVLDGVPASSSSHLPSCLSFSNKIVECSLNEFSNLQHLSPEIYDSSKYLENKSFPRSISPNECASNTLELSADISEIVQNSSMENNIPSLCRKPTLEYKTSSPCSPNSSKTSSPCSRPNSTCSKLSTSRPCSSCSRISRPSSGSSKHSSSCCRSHSDYSGKHLKSTPSVDSCDEISIGNLSEDFSSSLSCSGQVFCGNPGRAFRSLRSSSTSTSLSRASSDEEEGENEEDNFLKGFWSEITEDSILQNGKNENNEKRNEKWAFPVALDVNRVSLNSQPDIQYVDFPYDGDVSSLNSTLPQDEENLQHYVNNRSLDYPNVGEHLNLFNEGEESGPFGECEVQATYQISDNCCQPSETYFIENISLDENLQHCQELPPYQDNEYPSIYAISHELVHGIPMIHAESKFCDSVECTRDVIDKKIETQGKQIVLESALTTWERIEDTGLGKKLPSNRPKSDKISL